MSGKRIRFELISYPEGWKSLQSDWQKLFDRCEQPCVFYHSVFLDAAAALPSDEQPSHLVIGRANEELVFGLPVQIKRYGLLIRELNFYTVNTQGFDHLAPLDRSLNRQASREFLNHFYKYWGLNVLRGMGVDSEIPDLFENGRNKRLKFFSRRTFRCPYLNLPESEKELQGSISRNLRSQLKRKAAKAKAASIEFRHVEKDAPGYTFQAALENLYTLHEGRFSSLNKSSKFLTTTSKAFHTQLCREAEGFVNTLHFFEAVHHDRVVASLYGYVIGKRFYFYQSGFDTEYSKYSVGALLLYQTILYLIGRGIKVFDYLRGTEQYKFEWTKTIVNDYLIIASASPAGHLAANWIRLKRAMKRDGKKVGTWHWLLNKD